MMVMVSDGILNFKEKRNEMVGHEMDESMLRFEILEHRSDLIQN